MGIGTSDGKYYPTEMDHVLDDYQLDPIGGYGDNLIEKYDDSPTSLAESRDPSIYRILKEEEKNMERRQESNTLEETIDNNTPKTIADVHGKGSDLEGPYRFKASPDNGGWGPRPKDLPDNIEWAPFIPRVREWHSDPDVEALEYKDRSELKKLVPEGYEGFVTEMADGKKYLLRRPVKKTKPPLTS